MIKTKEGWAILENDTHIGLWVQQNKRLDFDQNSLPVVLPYIKAGDTVVDIGANIGAYSYAFLNKVGKAGEVLSFEPYKPSFECLEYNLGGYENVHIENIAIGQCNGFCIPICENDNIGMSFIKTSEVKNENTVAVVPLDDYKLKKCDFIKIDVEGYEVNVLNGAKNTILRHKPILMIEVNDFALERAGTNRDELFGFLRKYGYNFKNIYKEQHMNDSQLDILCF